MIKRILSFILFFFSQYCFAESPPDTLKKYNAVRINQPIKIDGKLDDDAWKNANTISDFMMNRPLEGGTPTQRTEVKIVYDNTAIYVGAMLFDTHPDSILHELGLRDAVDPTAEYSGATDINADLFRFVIDPYNQRQDAYDFGVYASGVQADSKFSDGTFDAVWESKTEINDKGWVCEMRIPYSAIRFPKKNMQQWGLQFTRSIRRTREFDQWSLTPSAAYNPQLYWGNLNGIENIQPPLRLSLTPYLSSSYERAPIYENDSVYKTNNAYSYRGGADLKYGIDERFTLDVTLLPDFSQVKSDNKIATLGYEEITYSENRPFFREGTELFSKSDLFYSRRIGAQPALFTSVSDSLQEGETIKKNPANAKLLNAIKLTGRTDSGLGIGLLNAITDNTYATLENGNGGTRKILTEPLTNFNVFVLDKNWKNNANLYFMNTNVMRAKKYNNANVSTTGFNLRNKKNSYGMNGILVMSKQFTKTETTQKFNDQLGFAYSLSLDKLSGRIHAGISQTLFDAKYNATDLGFYQTQNRIRSQFYVTAFQYKPWKFIREGHTNLSVNISQHMQSKDVGNFDISSSSFMSFLSYNAMFGGGGFTPMSGREYDPRLNGKFYNNLRYWYSYIGFSSDYRKAVAVDITQNLSNFSDRFKMEGYNTDFRLRYRVNDHLTLAYKGSYYYDPFNFGYVDNLSKYYLFGGRKTNTYINQLTARFIFLNDLSLSISGRHYWFNGKYRKIFQLQDNGSYVEFDDNALRNSYNFSYNFFNVDVLFTWRFAPGSDVSISYKNIYEPQTGEQYAFKTNDYNQNFKEVINRYPHTNNFSIKVLYYLDYLYLRKKD
jgi:hypothetical protein